MNGLEKFEAAQQAKLSSGSEIPEFAPGDTLRVNVRVVEGDRERIQAYEGVCIARKNAGINSSFIRVANASWQYALTASSSCPSTRAWCA